MACHADYCGEPAVQCTCTAAGAAACDNCGMPAAFAWVCSNGNCTDAAHMSFCPSGTCVTQAAMGACNGDCAAPSAAAAQCTGSQCVIAAANCSGCASNCTGGCTSCTDSCNMGCKILTHTPAYTELASIDNKILSVDGVALTNLITEEISRWERSLVAMESAAAGNKVLANTMIHAKTNLEALSVTGLSAVSQNTAASKTLFQSYVNKARELYELTRYK